MGQAAKAEQHAASPSQHRKPGLDRRKDSRSRWGPARDLLPGIAKGPRKNLLQAAVDELAGPTSRIRPGSVCLWAAMLTPRARTDWRSPWCDLPYQAMCSLAASSSTSYYRELDELEELTLVGHENYAPGGKRREEREDGSVELVDDPTIAVCKKPKGGWIPSGREGSNKVVPSCPGCLWHHGGARSKVLVVSTRQWRLAIERSKTVYRVTPRDRARLLAVIQRGHLAGEEGIADPHDAATSDPHDGGKSRSIADPHDFGNSLSGSILTLKPSPPPSRLKGTLVEDDSPAAHRADAVGPCPVVSPAPSSLPEPPQCTEPPRAIARPSPPPAFDGFASRNAVPIPRSYESGGMQVVAIAPPSSEAIAEVARGHRDVLGDPPLPATPMERTTIGGALARDWTVEVLVDAARGQAISSLNVNPKLRTAAYLYATDERIQGCLDVWRKHRAKVEAEAAEAKGAAERRAARRLAEEARRGSPGAAGPPDVAQVPVLDERAFSAKAVAERLEAAREREEKARTAFFARPDDPAVQREYELARVAYANLLPPTTRLR